MKREEQMEIVKKVYEECRNGKADKDEVFFTVWGILEPQVKALIKRFGRTDFCEMDDLMQEARLTVLSRLFSYEPDVSMPGTYFLTYINAAFKEMCCRGRIPRYYADVKRKLSGFLSDDDLDAFSDDDISVLSEHSGISVTTIKNLQMMLLSPADSDALLNVSSDTASPEDKAVECDMREYAFSALASLDNKDVWIFVQHYGNGKTAKTIASMLSYNDGYKKIGMKKMPTAGSIRQELYKCRKLLKDTLDRDDIKRIEQSSIDELESLLED